MKKAEKIQDFMLEEYKRFVPILHTYQWPWETARWHELVFSLLVSIDDSSGGVAIARETTGVFANLDLLEIDTLANLITERGEPNFQKPELRLMLEILKRQGYDDTEAETAVVTICEAAHALRKKFDCKVQKYLRKYGELMLNEFPQDFSFSRLSDVNAKFAFANWLQNVLAMPVASSNSSVKALCEKFGIGVEGLVDIADRNDINVALVDDWAADYLQREKLEA